MKRSRQKARNQEYLFGINPVMEAIKAGRRKVFGLTVKTGAVGKPLGGLIDLATRKKITVERADIDKVARMAATEGHQGVVALVSSPVYVKLDNLIERSLNKSKGHRPTLAVLDGVMDPRNLGAIIRSAEAFNVNGVIFPANRAAVYTPVAAKASAGAGEHMNLCLVTNIAETTRRLRDEGFMCVALDGDADKNLTFTEETPVALILGGEGTGVRPLVVKRCDYSARIPITGKTGSLNVSSAAAVAFYIASGK